MIFWKENMKKIILLLILLSFILIGCTNDNDDEIYKISRNTSYVHYYNFDDNTIIYITLDNKVWDVSYTLQENVYWYSIYGRDIIYINVMYQGTLEILFTTGEKNNCL